MNPKLTACCILLLTLLFSDCVNSGEDKQILEIREQYQRWQEAFASEDMTSRTLYHVYDGEYFEEDEWVDSAAVDGRFVGEQVTVYSDDTLGVAFKMIETSPSGDWQITSEHYYWPSQQLFFVFWSMNTFQADEPVTVERRLYFDRAGEVIRQLESVYKINTKEEIQANYFDQPTTYWLQFDSVPFRDLVRVK